jgi:peroxiredoxin
MEEMVSGGLSSLRRMLPMLAGIPVAATLIFLALVTLEDGCGPLPRPEKRPAFPDFTLSGLDGRLWTLSDQRGNVVLVNLWATTCGPCLTETPSFVRVAKRFEGRGLKVVGISTDENPLEVVPEIVAQFHIPYPILAYNPGEAGQLRSRSRFPLAIESVPRTLLFDRAGRVARDYYGVVSQRILASDVEQLLSEAMARPDR